LNPPVPLLYSIPSSDLRNSTALFSDSIIGGGLGGTNGNPMRVSAGGIRTRGRCCPQPPQTAGGGGFILIGRWGCTAPLRCAFRASSLCSHSLYLLRSTSGSPLRKRAVNVLTDSGVVLSEFGAHGFHSLFKSTRGFNAAIHTHSGGV
jgi:hypothetical protein